jgi:hypothetical protein
LCCPLSDPVLVIVWSLATLLLSDDNFRCNVELVIRSADLFCFRLDAMDPGEQLPHNMFQV